MKQIFIQNTQFLLYSRWSMRVQCRAINDKWIKGTKRSNNFQWKNNSRRKEQRRTVRERKDSSKFILIMWGFSILQKHKAIRSLFIYLTIFRMASQWWTRWDSIQWKYNPIENEIYGFIAIKYANFPVHLWYLDSLLSIYLSYTRSYLSSCSIGCHQLYIC